MNKFKVAVVQRKSNGRDMAKNVEMIINIMKEAKCSGADVVLFPECFITGYELPITNEEAISEDCDFIKSICIKAAELKIGVVAPQGMKFTVDEIKNQVYFQEKYFDFEIII